MSPPRPGSGLGQQRQPGSEAHDQAAPLAPVRSAWPRLTAAEIRVLGLLPTHLSLGDIARELFVSRNTVKSQAAAIYHKLGANGRREAVFKADQLGLLRQGSPGERPLTEPAALRSDDMPTETASPDRRPAREGARTSQAAIPHRRLTRLGRSPTNTGRARVGPPHLDEQPYPTGGGRALGERADDRVEYGPLVAVPPPRSTARIEVVRCSEELMQEAVWIVARARAAIADARRLGEELRRQG